MLIGFGRFGVLQAQDAQSTIQVTGAVKQPLMLSADDLAKMPRASVHTNDKGRETVYQRVWLHEILKRAGIPVEEVSSS